LQCSQYRAPARVACFPQCGQRRPRRNAQQRWQNLALAGFSVAQRGQAMPVPVPTVVDIPY
jgi:hypothetical protein